MVHIKLSYVMLYIGFTEGNLYTAVAGHHADAGEGVVDYEGLVVIESHVGLCEDDHGAPPRVQVGVLLVMGQLRVEGSLHVDHRGSLGQNNLYEEQPV